MKLQDCATPIPLAGSTSLQLSSNLPFFDREWISELRDLARVDGRAARVCLHDPKALCLQVMVVSQQSDTYWRPKRHLTSDKLLVILDGTLKLLTFNELGQIQMSQDLSSEGRCMALVLSGSFHTTIACGTGSVHLEVMHGSSESLKLAREYLASSPDVDSPEVHGYLRWLLTHEST